MVSPWPPPAFLAPIASSDPPCRSPDLIAMLVYVAWFSFVRRPPTDRAAVIITTQPSHNALLVKRVSARQATQNRSVLVAFQADRAFRHRDNPHRKTSEIFAAWTPPPFRLLVYRLLGLGSATVVWTGLISAGVRDLVVATTQATHTSVVAVHEVFGASRLRFEAFLFQFLFGSLRDSRLEGAANFTDEHERSLLSKPRRPAGIGGFQTSRERPIITPGIPVVRRHRSTTRTFPVTARVGVHAARTTVFPDRKVVNILGRYDRL